MAHPTTTTTRQLVDPRTAGPRPPFPKQAQRMPGETDFKLDPAPDHGEQSYVGNGRLAGLATLVTGADSGIGRAVALAYAREGADVVVSYLEAHADADETIRLVEAEGRRAIQAPGDIGDERFARSLVERARDELGRLDVLVNNAAYQQRRDTIADVPTDEWERALRTNLTGMFLLCREAIPHMEPGGSIINTASIQAKNPSPSLLAYATTKGGIVTFSKALSAECIRKGIRVNVVAPGPVWTPLVVASSDAESNSTFGQQSPIGRPAQPAELAPAFVFLASPESSYVTGEVIAVTGGEFFS
jgi:NAD(P)-dependent dehydrogenase (short-subunit alcohol dehydrogenase family)